MNVFVVVVTEHDYYCESFTSVYGVYLKEKDAEAVIKSFEGNPMIFGDIEEHSLR